MAPNPTEAAAQTGVDGSGESISYVVAPGALPAAFVFKTMSDQYGKYSFVKVMSGTLRPDMQLYNATTGNVEKLGRMYTMRGKKSEEVKELTCGDLGAITKMEHLRTGDTLCDPGHIVKFDGFGFAQPNLARAIAPQTRGQEDKVALGLAKLNEEDPTFRVENNAETHQMVLTTAGDLQLDRCV